jgi:hypothetical protein
MDAYGFFNATEICCAIPDFRNTPHVDHSFAKLAFGSPYPELVYGSSFTL